MGFRSSSVVRPGSVFPIPLILKQFLGVILALQLEELLRLWVGAIELLDGGMQAIGQVIATS